MQKPNQEVNFFAGVLPDDVAAAGPGALLALALPAWHGWLYTAVERQALARVPAMSAAWAGSACAGAARAVNTRAGLA